MCQQVIGRTIRVDHVEQYKIPKDPDKLDEDSLRILHEGCGPNSAVVRELTLPAATAAAAVVARPPPPPLPAPIIPDEPVRIKQEPVSPVLNREREKEKRRRSRSASPSRRKREKEKEEERRRGGREPEEHRRRRDDRRDRSRERDRHRHRR